MKEIVVLFIVFTIKACLANDSVCIGHPDNSHLPYPGDCTRFYVCVVGKATEQYCKDKLHFSPKRFFCQAANLAECERPAPSSCDNAEFGELIRHPDCTKYYVCMNGPVPRPCPDGLHFNEIEKVCDWKERANCKPMMI